MRPWIPGRVHETPDNHLNGFEAFWASVSPENCGIPSRPFSENLAGPAHAGACGGLFSQRELHFHGHNAETTHCQAEGEMAKGKNAPESPQGERVGGEGKGGGSSRALPPRKGEEG